MSGRCCSFCGSGDHNIRDCNHPCIAVFYEEMKNIYDTSILNSYLSREIFARQIYMQFELNEVRVIGIKYANTRAQSSKMNHIIKIYYHFYEQTRAQYNNGWLMSRNAVEPVPVHRHNISWLTDLLPWSIDRKSTAVVSKYNICLNQDNELNIIDDECSICYNKVEKQNAVQLGCQHQFCVDCICSYFKTNITMPSCALCREPIVNINVTNNDVYNSVSSYCS